MKPLSLALFPLLVALAPVVAAQPAAAADQPLRTAVIVLYDGVELLDFAGPAEVLSHVGVMLQRDGQPLLQLVTAAAKAGPVRTQNQVTVVADRALADCAKADLLVVPGGATNGLTRDSAAMAQLRRLAADAEITFSVCTGAYLLGELGLLDGRRCTTHWSALRGLRARFPTAQVVADRVVDAGPVVTAAGVSAGIDGALHLVQRLYGDALAQHVADYIEADTAPAVAGRKAQCAYADAIGAVHQGEFEAALAALRSAFEQGFAPATEALRDPYLRPLREDPDARLALSELLREHARSDSVQMTDRDEPGRPIRLTGQAVDADSGAPLGDALVQLFHTDHGGEYRPGMDAGGGAGNPRLFGWLRTDKDGRFTVDTIMPERYPNSTVPRHVHYRVWAAGYPEFASECFFDADPNLTVATRRSAPQRGFPIVVLQTDAAGLEVGSLVVRVPNAP